MELSINPGTAERIAWGVWGVLSFIALIAWCRWRGTPQDQEKDEPAQGAEKKTTPKGKRLRSVSVGTYKIFSKRFIAVRGIFHKICAALSPRAQREIWPPGWA
jgi:hypothetical protein